jgi:hypothetical protein
MHACDYGQEPRFKSANLCKILIPLRRAKMCQPSKFGCATRSQALDSMHESARRSTCGLRRLLCLCALGSCSSGFLFWQRVRCAFILSVVRRLLRLSWLRVLQLLPELLWLWLGRLLSALVAALVLRRVLWRVAQARVERRVRLASRRMARPSLIRSLGHDDSSNSNCFGWGADFDLPASLARSDSCDWLAVCASSSQTQDWG